MPAETQMKTQPVLLLLLALAGLAAVPSRVAAQTTAPNLGQLSLEDLMNIEITSVSRKGQRAGDVAAAVFVISRDDIRRSGMTTIPDLLRLAPGVDVAQINSNKWAISVRGFNGLFANKLLVLVDGRSVYNRLFSGVLWDTLDVMVDDIDRIEVVRGPGAAMWGANAVNGVINIVTRPAADTQGGLVRVDAGRPGVQGAVRYGGSVGGTRYRLYSQWTGRDQSLIAPGTPANDASHSTTTGFRADRAALAGTMTFEGAFTAGQARALWVDLDPRTASSDSITDDGTVTRGGHVLGRWARTRAGQTDLQVQAFLDMSGRQEPLGDYRRRAIGVDAQFHAAFGARHDLVAGAGYRFVDERFSGRAGFSLTPAESGSSLVTAFLQDEISFFAKRLALTIGSQVQYDSDAGAGVQPTVRLTWKAGSRQRLWVAASRALRTPSLTDRGVGLDYSPATVDGLPLVISARGNPAAETEHVVDTEAGYRIETGTAAIDVTGFAARYDHLTTQEPSAPIVQFVPSPHVLMASQFGNELQATTRGLEVAGHWAPIPAWRLDGSYTAFRVIPHLSAASRDPAAATEDGNAPRTQWQARSTFSPATRATFGVAIFHVGSLERLGVPAYTRADITAEWRLTSRVSVMAIGQNLFAAAHAEFGGAGSLLLATQVPRSGSVRLRWVF
jgi:iron complex outermembrane receptor protein